MPVKLYGTPARGPRSMQAQPRRAAAAHSLRPRAGLSSVGLWGLNLSVGGHGRANACGCPCAHRHHHAGATRQPQPGRDGGDGVPGPRAVGGTRERGRGVEPEASVRDQRLHRRLAGPLRGRVAVTAPAAGPGDGRGCHVAPHPRQRPQALEGRWTSYPQGPAWGPPPRRGVSVACSCLGGHTLQTRSEVTGRWAEAPQ